MTETQGRPKLTKEERERREEKRKKWQSDKIEMAADPLARVMILESVEMISMAEQIKQADRMLKTIRKHMGRLYPFEECEAILIDMAKCQAELDTLTRKMCKLTGQQYRKPYGLMLGLAGDKSTENEVGEASPGTEGSISVVSDQGATKKTGKARAAADTTNTEEIQAEKVAVAG
ncbi:MAG: hypothetical protein CSYNP_02836 [Syntrophus sp. SKADARSKE-3]|nr:hypothetical protein [Syntrophus sp. SKADARSKE-3]